MGLNSFPEEKSSAEKASKKSETKVNSVSDLDNDWIFSLKKIRE